MSSASVFAIDTPIHSIKGDDMRKNYHSSLNIQWTKQISCDIQLGDVLAISNGDGGITSKDILDWDPQNDVDEWQPGLVLGLQESLSRSGDVTFTAHIQWLILATQHDQFFKQLKKGDALHPKEQLPFILLMTQQQQQISLNRIYPARITMISRTRLKKERVEDREPRKEDWWYQLFYHCPRTIVVDKDGNEALSITPNKDDWQFLSYITTNTPKLDQAYLPKALEQGWDKWRDIQEQISDGDLQLLQSSIQSFQKLRWQRFQSHLEKKNASSDHESDHESYEAPKLPAKRQRTPTRLSSNKRVRIRTPEEVEAEQIRAPPKAKKSTQKKPQVLTKSSPKPKAKRSPAKPAKKTKAIRKTKSSSLKAAAESEKKDSNITNKKLSRKTKNSAKSTSTTTEQHISDGETSMNESNPLTEPLEHSECITSHAGKDYYTEMTLEVAADELKDVPFPLYAKSWGVHLGQIVALASEGSMEPIMDNDNPCIPFARPWRPAQIVGIFHGADDKEWNVVVRWLYRYQDFTEQHFQKSIDEACENAPTHPHVVFEYSCYDVVPTISILPALVEITAGERTSWASTESHIKGIPLIHLKCNFIVSEARRSSTCKPIKDWEKYHKKIQFLPGPLDRGLKDVCRKVYLPTFDSTKLDMETVTLSPEIWKSENILFFDEATIPLSKKIFQSAFTTRRDDFSVNVGDIVPIRDFNNTEQPTSSTHNPFKCAWDPAQIVAIFKTPDGNIHAQIRWFNWFENLDHNQKKRLHNFDEPHFVFETEHYENILVSRILPARVVLTSFPKDHRGSERFWRPIKDPELRLPLIPFQCRHILVDEEIDSVADWNMYYASLTDMPQPLVRGLKSSPVNRPNKKWIDILYRVYRKSIGRRAGLELKNSQKWDGDVPANSLHYKEFQAHEIIATAGQQIYSTTSDVFYKNASLSVHGDHFMQPPNIVKDARQNQWSFDLGDVVCVANAPDIPGQPYLNSRGGRFDSPSEPFTVKWLFGQVVSIHQSSDGPVCIDVRRLYRESELPVSVATYMPPIQDADDAMLEVFESDDLLKDMPVSHVLAPAALYLGYHQVSQGVERQNSDMMPIVSCRCKYYFDSTHRQFQPIYCADLSAVAWHRRFLERGLLQNVPNTTNMSNRSQEYCATIKQYILSLPELGSSQFFNIKARKKVQEGTDTVSVQSTDMEKEGDATSCTGMAIVPPWSKYQLVSVLDTETNPMTNWNVKVGDLVAYQDVKGSAVYPFVTKWSSGRIQKIRLRKDANLLNKSIVLSHVGIDIRPFSEKKIESVAPGTLIQIVEDPSQPVRKIDATDLLGPLTILSPEEEPHEAWQNVITFLPVALRLLTKPERKRGGSDCLEKDQEVTEAVSSPAVYVDMASLRAFYADVELLPPYDAYMTAVAPGREQTSQWTVRLGDIVTVKCGGIRKKYPMEVNWGIAEIISIWKEYPSRQMLRKEGNGSKTFKQRNANSEVNFEVRWFWTPSDLARFGQKQAFRDSEEMFETDHVDIITAESILSPAVLHSNIDDASQQMETRNGMPVPRFFSKRFWSVTKHSLVPTNGLAGLSKRGKLYSRFTHINSEVSKARMNDGNSSDMTTEKWEDSYSRVIKKLTLKDASVSAYQSGEALVGREKELTRLREFLTAAIRGDRINDDVKSSILLAGPPGVGKTACVRSVVEELIGQQHKGKIPPFRFIALNGMEMQDPREAYVRLWDALEGRGSIQSPEEACKKLESHFTNQRRAADSAASGTVSVVLLDEIDYLVTDQQTVLYNFFDWPQRAAEQKGGRRLVVIGISNTLNLAEQLMTRVRSRVGKERLGFQAYNVEETVSILNSKIKQAGSKHKVFETEAIIFAAKKTAALCGDIRKAFLLCRSAAEMVMTDFKRNQESSGEMEENGGSMTKPPPTVRVPDIQRSSTRSFFHASQLEPISLSSTYEALMLIAIAALKKHTGREVGGFDIQEVITKVESVAGLSGNSAYSPTPNFDQVLSLLQQLSERDLIQLKTAKSTLSSFRASRGGGGGAWPLVSPLVEQSTLIRGLRDTPHVALAQKLLAT